MISIGVDIGGTFTDIVSVANGRTIGIKVPTSPDDPTEAVIVALERVLAQGGYQPSEVTRFAHGTTVATNALVQRAGARIGLITNAGFEDVLEIGRQIRPREMLYRLDPPPQTPTFLVPRRRRCGVRGRIDSEARILEELDAAGVRDVSRFLVEEEGVTAIAVCFLFAFIRSDHELLAREIILREFPEIDIALSHEVDPAMREYERTCTTCTDAYIRPAVRGYIGRLEAALGDLQVPARLQIMQSRGALAGTGHALRRPISLIASGPAAGVEGAIEAGRLCSVDNLITVDVGGTSTDVALVVDGKPLLTRDATVSGFPIRARSVDVNSIGAGGGSIAWLDGGGGLRVGPESAGAVPGPCCYGRGGDEPTVTDASVVLGYLNPEYLAGGDVLIYAARAQEALASIGTELGLTPVEAALGIHRVVNAAMAAQIRMRSLRRGFDPRKFTLTMLGGAGPVHGAELAHALRMRSVLIPSHPGVLCASGLLGSRIEHEVASAWHVPLSAASDTEIHAKYLELEEKLRPLMAEEDVPPDELQMTWSADLRYIGQSYELAVDIPRGEKRLAEALHGVFLSTHEAMYGHKSQSAPVELTSLRVAGAHRLDLMAWAAPPPRRASSELTTRLAYFLEAPEGIETPVYQRQALHPEQELSGPAIIEQVDTTTVIPPGWEATVQSAGSLLLVPPKQP